MSSRPRDWPGATTRSEWSKEAEVANKKTESKPPMTTEAAARIQSNADRTGTNQEFKSRAQAAVAKQSSEGSSKKK